MKLHNDDDQMIGSGNRDSRKFKIASSAKAFKILSQNLYKNQIRAIIRELSCNAADAHVLAGHTDSFDIQLPTRLDNRFIIRDYGPGLSHEDVTQMYTTYFESTKADSNDFIGALGLGSKSPFGYTETFNVVSYHNGRARGYTAALDNGEPVLIDTFDKPSEDRTGLEITVPVKSSDVGRWTEEARYVYRTFCDIKPNFIGFELEIEYLPTDSYFIEENAEYGERNFYAVMGKIRYPIDEQYTRGTFLNTTKNWSTGFYIRFDLGELDIAPSREEISYDEETEIAIKKRINDISAIYAKDITDSLDECTTKREFFYKLLKQDGGIYKWIKANYVHKEFGKAQDVVDYYEMYKVTNDIPFYFMVNDPKVCKIEAGRRGGSTSRNKYSPFSIMGKTDGKILGLIDDQKGRSRVQVIRGLTVEPAFKEYTKVICFEQNKDHFQKSLDEIKEYYDDITFYKLSDLQKYKMTEEKKDYIRPKASNVMKFNFKKNGDTTKTELFLTAKEVRELTGHAYYIYGDNVYGLSEEFKDICVWNHLDVARKFGLKEIYLVRPAARKYALESKLKCALTEFRLKLEQIDVQESDVIYHNDNLVYRNCKKHKLDWLIPYFVKTKENFDENKFNMLFEVYKIQSANFVKDSEYLAEQRLKFHKFYNEAANESNEYYQEFIRLNPILSDTLSSWNFSEEYAKDVNRVFKDKIATSVA